MKKTHGHQKEYMGFKVIMAAVSLLVAQYASAQNLKADTWTQAKEAKKGTIVLAYIETPGLAYKTPDGKVGGIAVDVMNDFVKYLEVSKGVKVDCKFEGASESDRDFYSHVKEGVGGVFGLGNVTITDARKREVRVSPAYINSFPMLITHNSVENLQDLKAVGTTFKFMKAYVTKGSQNERRILDIKSQYYKDLTLLYVSSSSEILSKVATDDNSFTYLDVFFYLDAVKKKMPIKRHASGDKSTEDFGIIMPLSTDWDDVMKEFFDAKGGYTNSPEYKKSVIKHLGSAGAKLLASAPKGAIQ